VPGTEEYLESEKYQYRQWDWERPGHIRDLITLVNRIRRNHRALQSNDGLLFCQTDNPHVIAFAKISSDEASAILVVVNLDDEHVQEGWVQVPLARLGVQANETYEVVDQLDDAHYSWRGEWNYVKLDPLANVAHILTLPIAAPDIVTHTAAALHEFLPRQRWFSGKARTLASARLLDWSTAGASADDVVPAIADVEYTDGGRERYFMPLATVPEAKAQMAQSDDRAIARVDNASIVDALADPNACRALLASMLAGRSVPMRHGMADATVYRHDPAPGSLRIIRSGAEQSNTSIRFDDRYVLKVIRRLESGLSPELEISRFLTTRGFIGIPPLVASLEYRSPGDAPCSLCLLHGFIANDGTGWDRALDDVHQFLQDDVSSASANTGTSTFLQAAALLGRRTAELHGALAADDRDAAFAPEPMTTDDVSALVAGLQQDVNRSLAMLAERIDALPLSVRDRALTIVASRAPLDARIARMAAAPAGSWRTRVHGDYHLGQVLVANGDFVIIDFEGEPARSIAERRAKQSPLKDVAGMLRSFSYAAHVARLAMSEQYPKLTTRLVQCAGRWEAAISAAFLERYRQTSPGSRIVPADDRGFGIWLDLFLLDKALYELRYELANRPLWAAIPLLGIERILNAPGGKVDVR
jgi:maltose alpha-D-glucosyltransferase/alpha-amylase